MGKKTELVKNSVKNAKPQGKTNWAYFWLFEFLPFAALIGFIVLVFTKPENVELQVYFKTLLSELK